MKLMQATNLVSRAAAPRLPRFSILLESGALAVSTILHFIKDPLLTRL